MFLKCSLLIVSFYFCGCCEIPSFRNTEIVLKSLQNESSVLKISGCLSRQTIEDSIKLQFEVTKIDCLNQTIPVLYKEAVANLYSVKSLRFSYNKLNQIKNYAFNNIPNLEHLDLTHNKLTKIEHWAFSYLPMKVLDLSYNNLKEIEWHMFKDLPKLTTFLLNYNQIFHLKRDWFTISPNITKLEFIGNNIWAIDNFDGVPGLLELNLSHNKISQISDIFNGLENLQKLNLSYNKLEDLNSNAFQSLKKLSELWLQHNNLTYFDEDTMTDLFFLKKLAIFTNPWLCSCLKRIFNWINDYNIELVSGNSDNAVCVIPMENPDQCKIPSSSYELREIYYRSLH